MEILIKYFGMIAEVTQRDEERFSSEVSYVNELLSLLKEKYPLLETKDFQVAQNNTIVKETTELDGSEIAILPPFAGG